MDGETGRRPFGPMLRELRLRAGLTQEELAARAGMSVRSVSDLERGLVLRPRGRTVAALVKALALSPDHRCLLESAARAGALRAVAEREAANLGVDGAEPGSGSSAAAAAPSAPVGQGLGREGRPRQLPADLAAFVGRERGLGELDALLGSAGGTGSAVAIVGIPGVGKTALAVHWGHRHAALFPDGQLFLDLRGYDPVRPLTPAEALDRFLRALGVEPGRIPGEVEEAAALYRSVLADRRVLIILDNVREARQIRPLLPGGKHNAVVVTSRNRLTGLIALNGLRRLTLGVLPVADAVDVVRQILGEERCRGQKDALTRMVNLCGRLPLALRIAAAHLEDQPHRSVADYANELSCRRVSTLAVPGESEHTVVRAFDLSYGALAEPSRRMFRLLGACRLADVAVPAAAALADVDEEHARVVFADLADAHLVIEHRPGRHTLHDLLREYAEQLAQARQDTEAEAATGRLLQWYLNTTDPLNRLLLPTAGADTRPADGGPVFSDSAQAMAWCEDERPNCITLIERAHETGFHAEAWRLAANLSAYFLLSKHWQDWERTHRLGLACAKAAGDEAGQARMLGSLGAALQVQGRYLRSLECLAPALEIRRRLGDRQFEAHTLTNIGHAHSRLGRVAEAMAHYEQAVAIFRDTADTYGLGHALTNLAELNMDRGDFESAGRQLGESLQLFQDARNLYGEGMALDSLGTLHLRLGEHEVARKELEEAVELRRRVKDLHGEGVSLCRLGDNEHGAGRGARAVELWRQSLRILEALDAPETAEVRDRIRAAAHE